jgi:hypothetical protein
VQELHDDRKEQHDECAGKDERDEREEHLHGRLHRQLLGAQEAFGAPLIGLSARSM